MTDEPIRVGVDVGGTFTKAVAVTAHPLRLCAHAVVPTTHAARDGVAEGVATALRALLGDLGDARDRVELVAYSTTQAMNALLEGDVARVGVIGIGIEPELRLARKRTNVGDVKLAPGRVLHTEHAFLDATGGLDAGDVDAVLERLQAAGCTAVAVSGAFAVDAPEHERSVAARARQLDLPVCAGHELTGTYGLETRTISAAVNASILPVVQRTATVVARVLHEAGVDVPLLVLRGDGGAMSVEAFRRAPSFTIGSGPAAGVAAALHQLEVADAIVLECGGTSSNVSVVKGGRTVMRTLRVMGRPTAIRSVDSWVVGAAGGSMARLGRRRVDEVGPRSAHVAGLPYACYAPAGAFAGARLALLAPRLEDPEYAAVETAGGERYALTATCAAQALDGSETALAAFAPLGERLRRTPEQAAGAVLEAAVAKIAQAVAEAARAHDFGPEVPVVALGGAGGALAPAVARALGRECVRPAHPEILSSIGAALSLVRAEIARHCSGPGATVELAREAERACVRAGAAPPTVRVETRFEASEGILRAVATGAVALESGAASREPVGEDAQRRAAAAALGVGEGELGVVARNDFYRVFSQNGSGAVAVVDGLGSVALAEHAKRVLTADGDGVLGPLREAVRETAVNLGVATLLPRVSLVCGPHVVDLSDARRPEDLMATAEEVLDGHEGPAVAVVS
ncbi:MAG: N-methylhydantoinase [Solirubrobacteraceae bacterium]|jgi:N-methylhydantoinase A/oxoprolinase/acetone carboxylase beta subunit|nr:N-methylhydantoinase [Solirubrobacteraceae bacterium]